MKQNVSVRRPTLFKILGTKSKIMKHFCEHVLKGTELWVFLF